MYIATEYELPAGGRIDATLVGDDDNGNHHALVIELKQLRNSIAANANNQELLLNIYRVMLTRAKKGLAIWFKDEETKNHFKEV